MTGLQRIDMPFETILPNTDYYEIDSPRIGTRLAVWVTRPSNYSAGEPLPAIYLPDGNSAVCRYHGIDLWNDPIHPILPFLQICVGYVGAEAADALRVRNRDLLPPGEPVSPLFDKTIDALVGSKLPSQAAADAYKTSLRDTHADRFLAFLIGDLHPLIAARYAIDERRSGLFGYSYGGLFAAWAALQRPALFSRIGAGSPGMLTSESRVFAELARHQREGLRHDGRMLHMTVCDLELTRPTFYQMIGENFGRFTAAIGATPLPGLRFSAHIVPNETHSSGPAPSWYSYLRTCYSVPAA